MSTVKAGKIVLIGAGHVGSSILNSILRMNISDDIVVINRNREKALGEVLDASHTTAFAYSANAEVRVGDYDECGDAQVIIITVGATVLPGEHDRTALLRANIDILSEVMERITTYTRSAILINVSNPTDILTYYLQRKFDYPKEKIMSTGTLLDTARFNKMLGDLLGVDAKNVTGFVLGEHGSTCFIPWNTVNIIGIPFARFQTSFALSEPIDKEKLLSDVKSIGYRIVSLKGYTDAGVSLAACRILGAVMRNEKAVLPVSAVLSGEYGINDVAMSLPCVISKEGIDRVLTLDLDEQGARDFGVCYSYLRGVLAGVM